MVVETLHELIKWYWRVDVPFDSFAQIRPQKMAELGQNFQNSGFSKHESFQAVSLQRMVEDTCKKVQMKGLGVWMCRNAQKL